MNKSLWQRVNPKPKQKQNVVLVSSSSTRFIPNDNWNWSSLNWITSIWTNNIVIQWSNEVYQSIERSIFYCISESWERKVWYIESVIQDWTELTLNVVSNIELESTDSAFRIMNWIKIDNYSYYINILWDLSVDLANPQWNYYRINSDSYVLPVNATVLTAATWTWVASFNVYSWSTKLILNDVDFWITNTVNNIEVNNTWIDKDSIITARVLWSSWTTVAKDLNLQIFLIPQSLFTNWDYEAPTYFNGSTTFAQSNDIVAKTAYNGTVSGNVTIGSDGSENYIALNKAGLWNIVYWSAWVLLPIINSDNYTIDLHFYIPSSEAWIQADIFSLTWTSFNRFRLLKTTGNEISLYNSDSWSSFIVSAWVISYNTWYKLTIVNSSKTISTYIDWVLKNSGTYISKDAWSWDLQTWKSYWATTVYQNIYIKSFRIYSIWLDATQRTAELALWQKQTARKDCVLEILPDYFALPAAPTTVYDSVGNNNGTATTIDVADNAFSFTGASDVITLPVDLWISNWNSFTISIWAYITSIWASRTQNIFNARPAVSRWIWIRVLWNASAVPTFEFAMRNDAGQSTVAVVYDSWFLNNRSHLVWTYDSWTNIMKRYINWTYLWQATWRVVPVPIDTTIGGNFARWGSIDWFSNWKITWTSLYNRAISDSEVTEIYNAWRNVRTPVTSWLIAEYRPSPSTIYDVKAFTPATPVVIQTTFSKTASWSDNVVFTPYIWLQCLTGNIQSTIDQWWGKNSTYTVIHWPTFTAVVTWAFVNWSYVTKLFVDGILRDSDTWGTWALTKFVDYISLWRNPSNLYLTWTISNTKVYIWTITDTEWVAMSSWIAVEPVNANLFAYPRRLPPYTSLVDVSWNWYNFTLTQ